MNSFAQIVFWLSFIVTFYVYVGYPLLLALLSVIFGKTPKSKKDYEPKVTLMIASYNEEKYVGNKIENALKTDYPKDKLEIIVFSDGSTDKTDQIIKSYKSKGVIYNRVSGRVGKTICQNETIKKSNGEVVVFSDTKSLYEKNTVRELVKNFADDRVGTVIGRMSYKNKDAGGEGLYWKIEQWMKEKESSLAGSTAGTGSVYAVRRDEYVPLPNFAVSDFIEPIRIFLKYRKKPIVEPGALCFNVSSGSSSGEYKRHERIITRYHFSKKLIREAYNPIKNRLFSLELLSHRSLRFVAPFFLISLFLSNILLTDNRLLLLFLALQTIAYLGAIVGLVGEKLNKKMGACAIPYHFVVLNAAALKAWYNYLRGKNFVTWKLKGSS